MVDSTMAVSIRGASRILVESTTVDLWLKQFAFISSWSLVETSLIYLRWLIQLWLFQYGVRVGFWLNQPRLIPGWNNLLSSLVDLWLKQAWYIWDGWFNYGCFNPGCEYNSGWFSCNWSSAEAGWVHLLFINNWNKWTWMFLINGYCTPGATRNEVE